ncbi:hypothetical protein Y032_0009g595 [Ancylostoma ceylanicum]|uniref:Uncharacterized protein n=1 Tax=Ancylostoma ceylanicum TaxID=53326 RepID=A0A016VIW4_9BILA|nr:hypothetical protein Y032_0009g595 [Ancylostoma ceylanicum]
MGDLYWMKKTTPLPTKSVKPRTKCGLRVTNGTELRRFSLCLLTQSLAIHGQMRSTQEMEQGERNGEN